MVIGEGNTGASPTTALSGEIENHSIGTLGEPIPGRPGIPAGCGGTALEPKDASKMNEFPVVLPAAFDVERGMPPPVSPGFFQMYEPVGPEMGESPQ